MKHTDTCCSKPVLADLPGKHQPQPHDQQHNHEHEHDHEHDHKNDHKHDHKHEHDHGHGHHHGHDHGHQHAHGGCCGAPQPAATPAQNVPAGAARTRLHISAMDCPTEEALIRRSLKELPQVLGLDFDLLSRILTIHHHQLDLGMVQQRLESLGMAGQLLAEDKPAPVVTGIDRATRWRVIGGSLLAFGSEMLAWFSTDQSPLVIALAVAAILICGLPTLKKGWIALRHLTLNIHLLMTAAVIGAFLLGQWPEAAMVICLFAVAEMIEALSLIRARDAISGLMSQAPETTLMQQPDGSWQAVDTAKVPVGALLQCRPGDRIALDGTVELGRSAVNQAAITGESLPVEKNPGDQVYAGTLNQSGSLQIRVTAAAASSMLARIAESVQQAQSQRAPTQGFVDRFAAVYTPLVFVFAVLLAILPPLFFSQNWHDSFYRALVLLVIACPCALVISTPVTVVSGLALAARRGIVIKGGAFLEQAKALRFLALDKTGTLTEGKPALQSIHSFSSLTENDVLALAAALEAHSNHPIAHAVLQAYAKTPAVASRVALIEHGQSRGVEGEIDGRQYALGNLALLDSWQVAPDPAAAAAFEQALQTAQQQALTVILLTDRERLLGMLCVADSVRASSRAAVAELEQMGVSCIMLTGDRAATAEAVGRQAGIRDIRADLLPEDKLRIVGELSASGITGMTGDGINDAPALASAQLGLAMAGGSDTALETADVALMNNDLMQIPELIRISRVTGRVLKQNIAFALIVKFVFFALALSGHASLWMAVLADTGTSVLVVFNGMRLLRYQSGNQAASTSSPA